MPRACGTHARHACISVASMEPERSLSPSVNTMLNTCNTTSSAGVPSGSAVSSDSLSFFCLCEALLSPLISSALPPPRPGAPVFISSVVGSILTSDWL